MNSTYDRKKGIVLLEVLIFHTLYAQNEHSHPEPCCKLTTRDELAAISTRLPSFRANMIHLSFPRKCGHLLANVHAV